jgi:uncharacterized protein YndB with AHSA1/START domain
MQSATFEYVMYIHAPATAVWDALTDPNRTQQYWHDTRLESSWRVGEELLFIRNGEVTDRNVVLEVVQPNLLRYSFKPVFADFAHENPSRVTFFLDEDNGVTRLTLHHDEFAPESSVLPAIRIGWPLLLSSLKTLLERGTPLPVATFPTAS